MVFNMMGGKVNMIKHWLYLKYLMRHKYYVAIECFKRGLFIHAFTHDLSKFRPSEWFPYVNYFYVSNTDEHNLIKFDKAWLYHQHRNKHHWQYWILKEDETKFEKIIKIPNNILLQMVCDWIGASKAINGKNANCIEWYKKVKNITILHSKTRQEFEYEIGYKEEN